MLAPFRLSEHYVTWTFDLSAHSSICTSTVRSISELLTTLVLDFDQNETEKRTDGRQQSVMRLFTGRTTFC